MRAHRRCILAHIYLRPLNLGCWLFDFQSRFLYPWRPGRLRLIWRRYLIRIYRCLADQASLDFFIVGATSGCFYFGFDNFISWAFRDFRDIAHLTADVTLRIICYRLLAFRTEIFDIGHAPSEWFRRRNILLFHGIRLRQIQLWYSLPRWIHFWIGDVKVADVNLAICVLLWSSRD